MRYLYPFFIVFLLLSCKEKKEPPSQLGGKQGAAPINVDVIIITPTNLSSSFEVNGTVIASEFVEIRSEVSGRLTYLNIPEGAFVSKGALLAKINDEDLQAQLNKAKNLLDLALKTEQRLKKLLEMKGVNQADYDAAFNQANNYQADIKILGAQIEKTKIFAPINGTVGLRNVSPGSYVTPQTIFTTIQQTNPVKIDFNVPEDYANTVKKGSVVTIQIGNSTTKKRAIVIASEPTIDVTTRNLKVRAILQDGIAQPGSFVKVNIGTSTNAALLVPTNCIIPDARGKKVAVVKKGKADFVEVKTGDRLEKTVQIMDGIKVGDSVIVTGVLFVRPKSEIKIRSVKKIEEL